VWHYGRTPAHQIAANREMIRSLGDALEVDPAQAILSVVHQTAGAVEYCRQQIADGGDPLEQAMWAKLYGEERDRLVKAAATAIGAGVAERMVHLAEQQGQMIAQVIQAVLGELELTAEQAAVAPQIVRRHLLALPA